MSIYIYTLKPPAPHTHTENRINRFTYFLNWEILWGVFGGLGGGAVVYLGEGLVGNDEWRMKKWMRMRKWRKGKKNYSLIFLQEYIKKKLLNVKLYLKSFFWFYERKLRQVFVWGGKKCGGRGEGRGGRKCYFKSFFLVFLVNEILLLFWKLYFGNVFFFFKLIGKFFLNSF